MLNITLEPLVVAGLYALLFYPPYLRGLFFEPEYLPTVIIVGGLFLLLLLDRLNRGEWDFLAGPMDGFALAFVVAYVIPFLLGPADYHEASRSILKAGMYFAVYWMFSRTFTTEKGRYRALAVFFWGATGVAAVGLASAAGVFQYPGAVVGKEILSTFQYPNALAAYLMMANLAGVVLWALAGSRTARLSLAAANLPVFLVVLGTGSRGVWVILPFAFLLLVLGIGGRTFPFVLYNQVVTAGLALFISRPFYGRLYGGAPKAALTVLLVGMAIALAAELLREAGSAYVARKRLDPAVRWALIVSGIIYLVLVAAVYVVYTSQALPVFYERLVTPEMARQLQDIRVGTPSFTTRLLMSRDALRIAADYPAFGAGGGGWNALYHMYQQVVYWTTEVHNHFFQVLVESGILGLAGFMGLWYFFLAGLYRFWKKIRQTSDPGGSPSEAGSREWPLVWSLGVVALALGVHSSFDFDLSLPALGIILWAVFGMVAGGPGENKGFVSSLKVRSWLRGFGILAGFAVALVLIAGGTSFELAGKAGSRGSVLMMSGRPAAAAPLMERAARLDPWTASYRYDLAQIHWTLSGRETEAEERHRAAALALADEAARLEPYSIPLKMRLPSLYLDLGETGAAAREARRLVQVLPMEVRSWENLGRYLVLAGMAALDEGRLEEARSILKEVEEIPLAMEKVGDPEDPWAARTPLPRQRPEPSSQVRIAVGQSEYLAGKYGEATASLRELLGSSPDKKGEVRLWLAAALARQGRYPEAMELVAPVLEKEPQLEQEYRKIVQLGGKLSATSQQ